MRVLRGWNKARFAVVRDADGGDLAARDVAIRALERFAAIVGKPALRVAVQMRLRGGGV